MFKYDRADFTVGFPSKGRPEENIMGEDKKDRDPVITVSKEMRDQLKSVKNKGESYDDLLKRLIPLSDRTRE